MKKKIFVILLPLIIFSACLIFSLFFLKTMENTAYICPFYFLTGKLCPGCGCTRALASLLKFDIISSLRNNPVIIVLCISLVIWYIQLFADTFAIRKKIIPADNRFYYITGAVLLIYLLSRNFFPALQPL